MSASEAWIDIVPKFIRVPILAYKHRKLIRAWTYRGMLMLGWGRTDVVVLGRPGVGKSVLMERLTGRSSDLEWTAPDVSTTVESAVVTLGGEPLIIRTIPGQDSRERDNGLHEALSRHKKLQGVIYVADWGFNAPRDPSVQRDTIDRHGIDSIEKLRANNLASELVDFSKVSQRIKEAHSRTNKSVWLFVIVNKADLFYNRMSEAQSYYHSEVPSDFNKVLVGLREQIGGNNFHYQIVPTSAWHENFQWNNDTIQSHLNEKEARALFLNMRDKLQDLVLRLGN